MTAVSETTARAGIDPISFEVIRHKLTAITEEQAITLKAMSGSPIVTSACDFNSGIYGAGGEIVTMGWQVLFHSGGMASVIRHVIADCEDNPGIDPGDMFILNDPYRGGLHQQDVSLVAPIHFQGRRVAWTGTCAHQLDIGGMVFGSWASGATDIQQESMLLPGIKLVESGRLRGDLWRMVMGMTRLPGLVGLDLKAMIAANNVAVRRFGELIDRYGLETVLGVMDTEIGASERQFRAILASLPDGIFRAADFLEHDGHENRLYKIAMTLEKRGDQLLVDMDGSSKQAPGFINCTYSGLKGAFLAGMMPILAPGIRWNEGILNAISINAPEGTVVNASWPAPTSCATTSAMFCVLGATQAAVSRLVSWRPETRGEASGVHTGPSLFPFMAARGRDGRPWGNMLIDGIAGGGGAYAHQDGLDTGVDFCIPRPAIPNVESLEAESPYLYLYRSLLRDSGGPGRSRGGVGMTLALTPQNTPGMHFQVLGTGTGVPNSVGLFGGTEGASSTVRCVERGGENMSPVGRVTKHETLGAADGTVSDLPPKIQIDIGPHDIAAFSYVGGGGYGDPLERDPLLVLGDVGNELVSAEVAERCYGVVLRGDGVDAAATQARRDQIRRDRLGRQAPKREARPSAEGASGWALELDADGRLRCRCGEDLGPANENWKTAALTRTVDPAAHGPMVIVRDELEIREHICPACATLLESELVLKDEPSLQTIEFRTDPEV